MRKIRCDACPVRASSIACDVEAAALGDFAAVGMSAIYRPRQVIFAEGNPATGLYLVCHGRVKLFCSDRFGHEHVLGLLGPTAVFGEFALDDLATHATSAEATVESQVSFLARDRLAEFLERHPPVALRLLAALSERLARTRRQVRDLAFKGAESRLAAWLVELARGNGGVEAGHRVAVPFSRRDIAEMIGVSTETAIRLLGRLQARRAIALEPHAVVIVDPERLLRVARHDDAEP
ncbi:MAG: Crp/Fnr family transcriptional regulator [Thermodesulfobacteriota bacterium]